jgi:hypothetical protein
MSYGAAVAEAELVNASGNYRVGARRTLLEDALDRSNTMTFHSDDVYESPPPQQSSAWRRLLWG